MQQHEVCVCVCWERWASGSYFVCSSGSSEGLEAEEE